MQKLHRDNERKMKQLKWLQWGSKCEREKEKKIRRENSRNFVDDSILLCDHSFVGQSHCIRMRMCMFFFFPHSLFAYYSFRPTHKICTAKINSVGCRNILFRIIFEWRSENVILPLDKQARRGETNRNETNERACKTNQNKTKRKRYKTLKKNTTREWT